MKSILIGIGVFVLGLVIIYVSCFSKLLYGVNDDYLIFIGYLVSFLTAVIATCTAFIVDAIKNKR